MGAPAMSTPEIKFRCHVSGHEATGHVVNPGGWFPEDSGKNLWLIQVAIANALNPFVLVEAGSCEDAIDELADSDRFGHLINIDEDDADADADEDTFRAGNDGHPVCLDNVHIQQAPKAVTYFLEWPVSDYNLSSAIEGAVEEVRQDRADEE
jgi:hypothetical protein